MISFRPGDLEYAMRLEMAVWQARPQCGYEICRSTRIAVEWRPALGTHIPVWAHRAGTCPEDSCPVLSGGLAAWEAHEALWAALDPYLAPCGGVYGGYLEESDARPELVAA